MSEELKKMLKELSEDERENWYHDAMNVTALLKLIDIESAVCQVNSHVSEEKGKLVYAVVIPQSQFETIKNIVKKNISNLD